MAVGTLRSVRVEEGSRFIGVTFLYLFFALLLTLGVDIVAGAIMNNILGSALSLEEMTEALQVYIIVMIASAISLIILMIWIRLSVFRSGRGVLIPFILYSVAMGILLSSFNLFLPFSDIALAFGITTGIFGVMAAIGYFGGEKIKWFGIIGLGLLFGAIIISLVSLIWYFVSSETYSILTTIVMGIMLIAVLFITAFDVYNMKRIAESGAATPNLALYCAFNLYVDFIYILIRVLAFIMRNRR